MVGACLIGVWLHEMPAELVTRAATFKSCEEEICANAGGAFPYIVCLICSATHAAYILLAANLRELVVLEKLTGHQLDRDFTRIDLNSMVFYRVYKRSPLFLILKQNNTKPSHSVSSRFILIFTHLYLGLPRGFFASGLPSTTLNAFLISPLCTAFPVTHPPTQQLVGSRIAPQHADVRRPSC